MLLADFRWIPARVLIGVLALGSGPLPADAHHSFPAEFDRSKQGELDGTIVGVWYKNPHARYRLAVQTENGGSEEWDVQTTSVTSLRIAGWEPDTLKVGDKVRVWGDLGHGNTKKLFMRRARKADGTELLPRGPVRSREERDRINASAAKEYGYAQVNPDHPACGATATSFN